MKWSNAPKTGYVVDVVDALLKADKHLYGQAPSWQRGNRSIERRLVWPVLVEGELVGLHLNMTAYPDDPDYSTQRFTITLNLPPCIWRVDYDPVTKKHTNPMGYGAALGAYVIRGPNYHAWEDNRHLATPSRLPQELECARQLPGNIRTMRQAFRWFCDQTNIKASHDQMVDYPPKEFLV